MPCTMICHDRNTEYLTCDTIRTASTVSRQTRSPTAPSHPEGLQYVRRAPKNLHICQPLDANISIIALVCRDGVQEPVKGDVVEVDWMDHHSGAKKKQISGGHDASRYWLAE